jgi:hypothetical protein
MQFLKSIKTAKALSLTAVTAVTLISTTIAPTLAASPASAENTTRLITFSSHGAYKTNLTVLAEGRHTFSSTIPFGQTKELNYPVGTKVQVIIKVEGRSKVLHQSSFTLNDFTCLRTIGTIFNPAVVRC